MFLLKMIFMEVQTFESVHLAGRFQYDEHAEHSKQLPSARLLNELECLLNDACHFHFGGIFVEMG